MKVGTDEQPAEEVLAVGFLTVLRTPGHELIVVFVQVFSGMLPAREDELSAVAIHEHMQAEATPVAIH